MEWDTIYVAANQFKILNDQRAWFVATERVQVDCDGTLIWSSIDTVSFDSTYTIVTITKSVLTDPCTTARVGGVYSGATGNLPPHVHEDDDTGGSGVIGSPPAHELRNYNTEIRFKNPDGSWGEWQSFGYSYKEEWTDGHDYSAHDLVTSSSSSYGCLISHTADSTTEPGTGVYWQTYWFLLAGAGPEGTATPVQGRGQWVGNGYWETPEHFVSDAVDYVLSDLVYNHGFSYMCILAHNSDTGIIDAEPGIGSVWETYWVLFADNGYVNWITDGWESGIDYFANDALSRLGSTYICIVDHLSASLNMPPTGGEWETYWAILAEAGSPGITWIDGGWVVSTWYYTGDALNNDGSSYISLSTHLSDSTTEPGVGVYWATYWELIAEGGEDGTIGADGAPGLVWQGVWSESSVSYVETDCVENDGSSYVCILDHVSDASTEPGTGAYWATYWEVLAERGQQGVAGIIGDWLGPWEDPFTYVLNDCVSNDGSSYVCISGHESDASTEPGVGVYWATYWELIAEKGVDGSPGINWVEGGWQTATPYTALDGVSNDGSSYICILGHESDATTEPGTGVYWATYWEVLAAKGDDGEGGGGSVAIPAFWQSLTSDDTGYQNTTYRCVVQPLLVAGNQLRVKFAAHSSSNTTLDHVSWVERSGTTDDGTTTPTEITFDTGGHGTVVTGGAAGKWSDWINYTTDDLKQYLLILDFNASVASSTKYGTTGNTIYYKNGAISWDQQTISGTSTSSRTALILLEVQVRTV
jgi:hypothetical protein